MHMFMPCKDEPAVPESAISGFCAARNAPVVNIEMLEVGPARAGIMLAADADGALTLLVRVSLLSGGQGVTFKFQGDPADFGDTAGAIDAALSFSEGMGFLFEEDLLREGGRSGRSRAHKIWTSLCTDTAAPRFEADVPAAEAPGPVAASAAQLPEIELTRAIRDDEPGRAAEITQGVSDAQLPTPAFLEAGGEALPDASAPAAAMGSTVLTKFRERRVGDRRKSTDHAMVEGKQAHDAAGRRPGSEILARMAIESEEIGQRVVDDSGFLTRLLSSFWVSP